MLIFHSSTPSYSVALPIPLPLSRSIPLCTALSLFSLYPVQIFLPCSSSSTAQSTKETTFNVQQRSASISLFIAVLWSKYNFGACKICASCTMDNCEDGTPSLSPSTPTLPLVLRLSVCLEQHFSHSTQRKSIE